MKKSLRRIALGALLLVSAVIFLEINKYVGLALFLAAYIIVGYDVVIKAVRNITQGKVFDENFLMSLSTIGAFAVGQYPEAVSVMLFYQLGEMFQSYAVNKSRKSIADLMDFRPDYANIKKGDTTEKVDPYDVNIGDIIIVKPGEKIPLDGVIIEGASTLNTSVLTGESMPRDVGAGEEIMSGCININGLLTIKVTKEFGESTVNKILDLVENASNKKSKSENFISKFAAVYTPTVVIAALALAVIPPLLIKGAVFSDWFYRALTFLVVSCPCALVISIPLSFFGGLGGVSKEGILIKGSNYMEILASAKTVVFDKTGTLTKGIFNVSKIVPKDISDKELLEYTSYAENFSNHPISLSLKKAYGKEIDEEKISNVEEISGFGVSADVMGKKVLAGNIKLMKKFDIDFNEADEIGTIVYTAIDGKYAGYIVISDSIKENCAKSIKLLKEAGIKKTVMLTGDLKAVAENVANTLGIDEVHYELLPSDKVKITEDIINHASKGEKVVFVGDGINDAPTIAMADVGIAMGGAGSDAAIEAADVVIMNDDISKLPVAVKMCRKTLRIVKQNTWFALIIKFGVLIMSAFGHASMWAAVFADVGVSVIAILNAMRALKVDKNFKN